MLSQDKTAFIEEIGVPKGDKERQKKRRRVAAARVQVLRLLLDVRIAEGAVAAMEFALRDGGVVEQPLGSLKVPRRDVTEREVDAARRFLARKKRELARKQARLLRLERGLDEGRDDQDVKMMFRLHSANHHLECSERRFLEWSTTQVMTPIWVTTKQGRRWWWHSDRFWWDDQGLTPDEVRQLVEEWDHEGRRQLEAIEHVRAEVFRRQPRRPSE